MLKRAIGLLVHQVPHSKAEATLICIMQICIIVINSRLNLLSHSSACALFFKAQQYSHTCSLFGAFRKSDFFSSSTAEIHGHLLHSNSNSLPSWMILV